MIIKWCLMARAISGLLCLLFFSVSAIATDIREMDPEDIYKEYTECSRESDACNRHVDELNSRHEGGSWEATKYLSYSLAYVYGDHLDGDRSYELLKKSANAGLPEAMLNLAASYEKSDPILSIDQDYGLALSWYKRAAHAGEGVAIVRLIDAYEDGNMGVEKSAESAGYWKRVREKMTKSCSN